MNIVLASQSPYRKLQLENFGLKFTAVKPKIDEDALKKIGPQDLKDLTVFLAKAKAESLATDYPDSIILGSDQLAALNNERLDKPGSFAQAKLQLNKMQGKPHELITSLAVTHKGQTLIYTDVTEIALKTLSDNMIEAYLETDKPFDCAGSYKIEKAGLGLVASIKSQDPSAIQGLPMMSLVKAFEHMNIPLEKLWSPS